VKRRHKILIAVALPLGLLAAWAAVALSDVHTSTACATTTGPSHTVAVDSTPVATIPGTVLSVCATATATDSTVTAPTTTTVPTTTQQTTTAVTTSPPPSTLPCGSSLQAAYSGASPGADILLGSCAYTGATISGSKSGMVTIEAAPGASPTVSGGITNSANNLTLRGISASGILDLAEANVNASNIVFDHMSGEGFLIGPGHDITLSNSNIGPDSTCAVENKVGPDGNIPGAVPYDIKLIGNYIHDQNGNNPVSGCHFGGLFLIAGHHFLLDRNVFARNVVYDIQIQNFAGSAFPGAVCGLASEDTIVSGYPACLTIQNNWFAGPVEWLPNGTQFDNQPNVQFDCRSNACAYRNVLVRYNSFYDGVDFRFDGNNTLTNVRAVGNIGGGSNCSGAAYAYNVWGDGTCSSTDVQGPKAYVDGSISTPDYHLTGGVAGGLVPGTSLDQLLGYDFDNQARPATAIDAGSDER
jgi:hypothetical protein